MCVLCSSFFLCYIYIYICVFLLCVVCGCHIFAFCVLMFDLVVFRFYILFIMFFCCVDYCFLNQH